VPASSFRRPFRLIVGKSLGVEVSERVQVPTPWLIRPLAPPVDCGLRGANALTDGSLAHAIGRQTLDHLFRTKLYHDETVTTVRDPWRDTSLHLMLDSQYELVYDNHQRKRASRATMIPNWAAPGEPVVCIDENWVLITDDTIETETTGPEDGDVATITVASIVSGVACIKLAEWGNVWWELAGFRPATKSENDARLFRFIAESAGDHHRQGEFA